MAEKSYLYHNNVLSIPASLLYEDWQLMSYKYYNVNCFRGKLVRSREGKGKGEGKHMAGGKVAQG